MGDLGVEGAGANFEAYTSLEDALQHGLAAGAGSPGPLKSNFGVGNNACLLSLLGIRLEKLLIHLSACQARELRSAPCHHDHGKACMSPVSESLHFCMNLNQSVLQAEEPPTMDKILTEQQATPRHFQTIQGIPDINVHPQQSPFAFQLTSLESPLPSSVPLPQDLQQLQISESEAMSALCPLALFITRSPIYPLSLPL